MNASLILAINPGSTSTKIAVFSNSDLVMEKTLRHSTEELRPYKSITDQKEFRKTAVLDALLSESIEMNTVAAVIGRGGLLYPLEGGIYNVNKAMLADLSNNVMGEHASNLGGIIAQEIAATVDIPAYIADPVVVDEMEDLARFSGHPDIPRLSIFHALNQKAVARRHAKKIGKQYEELNLIVAHMGGGVSVGAHKKGRVIDVNNALDGEGPYSPERSGGLPSGQLAALCFSGKYTHAEIKGQIKGGGGLVAYLNTNDAREVEKKITAGDERARRIYEGIAYQTAKEIASHFAVLCGDIDAVILTGGLAYSEMLTDWITQRVAKIAPVVIYPGEDEMYALAESVLRVLQGVETPKTYKGKHD